MVIRFLLMIAVALLFMVSGGKAVADEWGAFLFFNGLGWIYLAAVDHLASKSAKGGE